MGRSPSTLKGQNLVFTGRLRSMTRPDAKARAQKAGAHVQWEVGPETSLIMQGQPSRLQVASDAGIKLIEARYRIAKGQRLAIIGEKRFVTLVQRSLNGGTKL